MANFQADRKIGGRKHGGAFAVKLVYLIERPSSAVTSRYQVAIAMIVYCFI